MCSKSGIAQRPRTVSASDMMSRFHSSTLRGNNDTRSLRQNRGGVVGVVLCCAVLCLVGAGERGISPGHVSYVSERVGQRVGLPRLQEVPAAPLAQRVQREGQRVPAVSVLRSRSRVASAC